MDKPLVSILINNYNYGCYLGDAIDSALNQTYPHIEVIVVDDGSTDNSREVIAKYGDRIIPVLKQNGGHSSALNAGFAVSKGDVICFLDADDIFSPVKVEAVLEVFAAAPDIGWCFHPMKTVETSDLASIDNTLFPNITKTSFTKVDFRTNIRNGEQSGFVPGCSATCFSRSILAQILPIPEDAKTYVGDTYMSMIALYLSKGCLIEQELTLYRVHGNNAYARQDIREQRETFSRLRVATGYWLRTNFPEIAKYSNVFFAKGLGVFWLIDQKEEKYKSLVKGYFSKLTWQETIEINVKAYYYLMKSLIFKTLP